MPGTNLPPDGVGAEVTVEARPGVDTVPAAITKRGADTVPGTVTERTTIESGADAVPTAITEAGAVAETVTDREHEPAQPAGPSPAQPAGQAPARPDASAPGRDGGWVEV